MNYFKLADMRNILQSTDEWLRHRIRSYVWKSWKKVGARFKNLVRCGIDGGGLGNGPIPVVGIGTRQEVRY